MNRLSENPLKEKLVVLLTLFNERRYPEAEKLALEITARHPARGFTWKMLAVLLSLQGRTAEALAPMRKAAALLETDLDAHYDLGIILKELGRPEEAEASLRRVLEIEPDHAVAHNTLGAILADLGRRDEAEAFYRSALEHNPDYAAAHGNLGNLLQETRRLAEARECYLRALALTPDSPQANNNLGNLLKELREFAAAEARYRHLLSVRPENVDAGWNLSLLLLHLERFEEGWPLYQARFRHNGRNQVCKPPELPFPEWSGQDLQGKSIAVWPEQGLGDEIQFVRYLPLLKARGAACVILVCSSSLKALFLDSLAAADRVISENEAAQRLQADFWISMLSLPLHFHTTRTTIPADLPYLFADGGRQKSWAGRLSGTGLRIGLVWKGGAGHKNDANRSLPGLVGFAPLWSVAGVRFFSLQTGAGQQEAASSPPGQPIVDLGADILDFSDTAAIVSQLDLVICVDTAISHLTAALGKPCWVLLPFIGTDWRWAERGTDTPWYPRVMRLFRQTEIGAWDEVLQRVTGELAKLAAGDAGTTRAE